MTPEERRRRMKLRRLLTDRRVGKIALAGAVGMIGASKININRTTPVKQPRYDDPVTQAVAETMIQRLAGRGWDLPNLDHERVDFWVDRFQNVPEMREKFEGFLHRSGRYVPMLSAKLAERDMPHDLIFLAMIESGFEPAAYSPAHASGLWQFIPETGRRYGLRVDGQVDERNHPEKATDAALDYLSELHERFDSWYLAAAAYNTGENRVGRIMREETGSEKASSEADYYKIWDRLPRETRDYVPLMIAAGRIAKDPEKYGFEHVIPDEAIDYDEVRIRGGTSLAEVAKATGMLLDNLKYVNAHLVKDQVPEEGYPVRLPADVIQRLASDAPILGTGGPGTRTAQ